jgi:hypothetical protein
MGNAMPHRRPISITNAQLDSILNAAQPLLPCDRSPFLTELARELSAVAVIGDGNLHRAIELVQRRHFSPPREISHSGPHHLRRRSKLRDEE